MRRSCPVLLALLIALLWPAGALGQGVPDQVIVQSQPAAGLGTYLYFPFTVPAGVNRVAVKVTRSSAEAKVGAGLFDQRGAQFGSPGFRGIYGEELSEFFVAADTASRAFVAGPIEPGTWTTVVPVFRAPGPTVITATMTLSFGPQGTPPAREPVPEVVSSAPGWYRGDLHNHTTFSSDAFSSKSALDPGAFAARSKAIGLDWVSLTDHNVSAQNDRLRSGQPPGFLTLGGEEVTNWFHGHSTATGMQSGTFYDWRWRPGGTPVDPAHEGRVQDYLSRARADGVYTSVAHPLGAQLSWQQFPDAAVDGAALPDGLEVWNGPFQPDDEATLGLWDDLLSAGRRVAANGGSDVHGLENSTDLQIATPTTVTYAQSLSRTGVVAALKGGRTYLTASPTGPELYLTATAPAGQETYTGGTIYGAPGDTAAFAVLVRGGAGATLRVLRDGAQLQATPITRDEQEVRLTQPVGAGGFVRVELRGAPKVVPGSPLASDLGVRALTNPIFLAAGPIPPGTRPERAPVPPRTAAPSSVSGPSAPGPQGAGTAGCEVPRGFASVGVRGLSGGRLRVTVRRRLKRPFEVAIFSQSQRGRVGANRQVVRFSGRRGSLTWSGRPRDRRGLTDGVLLVRVKMRIPGSRSDVRRLVVRRSGGRLSARTPSERRERCALLQVAKLERAVFGGRTRARGRLSVRVGERAGVAVALVRGGRVVRRLPTRVQPAGRLARFTLSSRGLPRGRYTVRVTARPSTGSSAVARLGLERE